MPEKSDRSDQENSDEMSADGNTSIPYADEDQTASFIDGEENPCPVDGKDEEKTSLLDGKEDEKTPPVDVKEDSIDVSSEKTNADDEKANCVDAKEHENANNIINLISDDAKENTDSSSADTALPKTNSDSDNVALQRNPESFPNGIHDVMKNCEDYISDSDNTKTSVEDIDKSADVKACEGDIANGGDVKLEPLGLLHVSRVQCYVRRNLWQKGTH